MKSRHLYWSALVGQWRGGLVLLGCSILEGVPAFFSGRLVELSVNQGFAAGRPWIGVGWLLLFGGLAVVGAFGSRLVWRQLGIVVEPMRDALVTAVVRGVLHGAPQRNSPDISGVARITQHVEIVRDATGGLLVQARALLVTVFSALTGMLTIAGPLSWWAAGPVLLSLLAFALLLPSIARRQRAVVLADEGAAETSGALLTGLRDISSCGAEQVANRTMFTAIDAQAHTAIRMGKAAALRTLTISVGGFLPLLLVLAVAPSMVATGAVTIGAVLGTLVYLSTALQPALQGLVATVSGVFLRLYVALRRLGETVQTPDPDTGKVSPAGSDITLRGVTFSWGDHAEPIVADFDFDIPAGDHVAIVGPSGIGKSTLAGLITGLSRPQSGRVSLGGTAISDIDPALLPQTVLLVPQETYVFAGTVRENLKLFSPTVPDDVLLSAIESLGASDLLRRLGGLAAHIGAPTKEISTGEAQLLALVRVYVSPASVIILDEATSQLDPAAEARVERVFSARPGTLIVIAHRLSSAMRAGRVLMMDGTAISVGTHDELLATSPRYAAMMRAWADPVQPVTTCDMAS